VTVTEVLTISKPNTYYTTTSYASYTTPASASVTALSTDHKIVVGRNGSLTYFPPNINASVGDTVTFEFAAKNHTATQSNFDNPCQAIVKTTGQVGFDSGFQPVVAGASNPTYTIRINDTHPIYGYCKQTGHCQQGMVFAINADNFEDFQAKALKSGTSTATPSGGSAGSSGSATAAGANGATTSTAGSASSTTGSNAISTSVNVGLTAVLAVVGGFILAL